jgi:hypothetical protein
MVTTKASIQNAAARFMIISKNMCRCLSPRGQSGKRAWVKEDTNYCHVQPPSAGQKESRARDWQERL